MEDSAANTRKSEQQNDTSIYRYALLPNEWKLCIIATIAVWLTASLFYVLIVYPLNMIPSIVQAVQLPVLTDCVILASLFANTVPLVSYVAIPCFLACSRNWVFDQVIDLFQHIQNTDNMNDKTHKLCSINTKNILSRGMFPCPLWIYYNPNRYQSLPPKWKFTLILYIAVLLAEMFAWFTFYQFVLSKWQWSNIQDAVNNDIDFRIRYIIYLALDLLVTMPIISYITLPFLTNRLLVKWCYKKTDMNNNLCAKMVKMFNQCLYSGMSCVERFDAEALIQYNVQQQQQQQPQSWQTKNTETIIDIGTQFKENNVQLPSNPNVENAPAGMPNTRSTPPWVNHFKSAKTVQPNFLPQPPLRQPPLNINSAHGSGARAF